MKRIINSFLTTFMLISRIPARKTTTPEYRFTVFFIPVVGIITAVLVSLAALAGAYIVGDLFLTAIGVLLLQYAAFNLFHFDGLLDSADAMAIFGDREKRLAILKDTNVGSFALFCGVLYLVTKVYLLFRGLAYLHESSGGLIENLELLVVLASYCVSGRTAGAILPAVLKPAKANGLGVLLSGSSLLSALLGGATATVIISLPCRNALFLIPIIASAPLAAAFSAFIYKKKVGGYTGDAIGLAVEIGELVHLFLFGLVTGYLR
jgi:adenosylcobinamide-GDP ribazoletransferase